MILIENFKLCLTLSIIGQLSGLSFNQPKFCPAATWNSLGTIFAAYDIIHGSPYSIFITTNNSIYVVAHAIPNIYIWLNSSVNLTMTITVPGLPLQSIFVKNDNELYVERGFLPTRNIEKWILNTNRSTVVMNNITPYPCYSIFIDIINNLYCSLDQRHTVVKNWLDDDDTTPMIVVGNGFPGSTSNTLIQPSGLFVDASLNLYVADFGNHRIQMFPPGESHAITVAGATSLNITTSLNYPTGVTMDGDGYLYIVDSNKNRIVREGLNGFQCIIGCVASGLAANQLSGPRDMAFDSNGNIYVADSRNRRIQKFSYSKTSCDPITNVSLITSSRSPSFNQPKFCPVAAWNPFGSTFSALNIIRGPPHSIFITTNNSIYVVVQAISHIYIWLNNSVNPTITITEFSSSPKSIFVQNDNELYIERGTSLKRTIEKRILNTNSSTPVMDIAAPCYSIFIDILNYLYCSLDQRHTVVKNWLDDDDTTPMIVAGTGIPGPTPNTLIQPSGLFVDASLNLYVADFGNHRIQKFRSGESHGITVAGATSLNITTSLNYPTGITMDGDGYLYIVDQGNHRIVRKELNGFRCILGCTTFGSAANELSLPRDMAFDSYGNIYVADANNLQIQKFSYAKVSCNPITNVSLLTSSRSPWFNQPKFCPAATWNSFGAIFSAKNIISGTPDSIFITTNNSIYVVAQGTPNIYIWLNNSVNLTMAITVPGLPLQSIFVQNDNELYIERGTSNKRTIEKWILNTNSSTPVMDIAAPCYSIFIDILNYLYCSLNQYHIIMKNWLDDDDTTPMIVAGTGLSGSTSNTLNSPYGVFVDASLNLYVADYGNHRIQMFPPGESQGITVAGEQSINTTITLKNPTGVTMDGDGYLYIVDQGNHRIVRGGSTGFRCILGCITSGSESYKLKRPRGMAFDSYGNIYVADWGNQRIQKFSYPKLSCKPRTTITRTTNTPVVSHSTKALAGYLIQCLMFFMLYI
ncbi:unnamed protein product [Adineta steineri]|uniref:NHL repeat containing protein-like protein n=1 Tax=Adineta steineri TaxID=433720 RepID=A0A813TTA7_9BILA|nr:unnamed protein product [Adineta steineri]CAF1429909.1 unnamed protein product [Adineta steineri]CAF1432954.1 unnamed protein product [Adineta steineri]